MDTNGFIKQIYLRLVALWRYFLIAGDISFDINMEEDAFTQHFEDYLESMGFKTSYLQKKQVYLSDNNSRSIIRNIINAEPIAFNWKVHSSDLRQCRLGVKFTLPFYLKIKLYLCIIVQAILQFGVMPWFSKNITDSDVFSLAIYTTTSAFITFLNLLGSMLLLTVLQKYKNRLFDAMGDFGDLAGIARPTGLPFHESPNRIFINLKLCALSLLIPLLPVLRKIDFAMPVSHLCFILIGLLILIYFLCLCVGTAKGSLSFARSTGLLPNFAIFLFTMILLVLIPRFLYMTSVNCNLSDMSIQHEHNVNILQMLSVPDRFSPEVVADTLNRSKAEVVLVAGYQLFVIMIILLIQYTVTLGESPASYSNGRNRDIGTFFKRGPSNQDNKLMLSPAMKDAVRKFFTLFSAAIWIVLLLNTPIIVAFIFPSVPKLHIGYGKVIYSEIYKLINIVSLGWDFRYKQYLPMILISPLLLVFFYFVLANIYYTLKASLQYLFMQKIGGEIQSMVDRIADEMGVPKVLCLQSRENSSSPRAAISDIKKRNIIVFTNDSLQFMEKYPNYAKAILAHEISHLKLHCAEIRENTIKSRCGFLGSTFLSLLYDSITMEDEADEEAKKYLVSQNIDENLVREAAFAIDNYDYLQTSCDSGGVGQVNFAASARAYKRVPAKRSFFIINFILGPYRAYKLYFGTQPYDYIHREAKFR